MNKIECLSGTWRLRADGICMDLDKASGMPTALTVQGDKPFLWSASSGDVFVRDDLLRKRFDRRDLQSVEFTRSGPAPSWWSCTRATRTG